MKNLKNVFVASAFVFAFGAALVMKANAAQETIIYAGEPGDCIETSCRVEESSLCNPGTTEPLFENSICTDPFVGVPQVREL